MPFELETADKLEYHFLPVNGQCFAFRVRAPHDAHLALCPQGREGDPMYEIFIGGWNNSKSVIRKNRSKPDVVEVDTPGILNNNEYRGFWIRWYDNVITVGIENQPTAFLSFEDPSLFPVTHVGVCTGWGATGQWIFDEQTCSAPGSAPSAPSMGFSMPSRFGGPGTWVPASNGQVPPDALEGGVDGSEQLYVARAKHEGALIIGKLHPSHGCVYIPWGGAEHAVRDYEVLCGASGQWVPVSGTNIPPNATPAGESETGEPLFIGRANQNGAIVVGKVQPSHGVCYIPYGGEELAFSDYEIFLN